MFKSVLKVSIILCLILSVQGCRKGPRSIPLGTWHYRLIVNGADIGSATMSNRISNGNYITTSDMRMDAGYIKNFSRQVVTETSDFKPLKLEIYNKTISNNQVNEVNTIATFKGKEVTVKTGDIKTRITIERPFIIEGNFYFNELIKRDFKIGTVIKAYVYEPTIEVEEPILVIIKVLAKVKILINGTEKEVIHLGYSIENMKNMDLYIDKNGIIQKAVIVMLNNKLELHIK